MKITITRILFAAFVIVSGATAFAAPAAEKEWTFLLFLNGHNNLSSYGDMNIIDMEKTGSTDKVNYVVEWGSDAPLTHRLLVQKSTNTTKVTSPIIMSLENHDMGDYKNLVEFVKWGVTNYPAKKYFVAVWNHGSGWHRIQKTGMFQPTDISYDDNTGNHITTEQLGQAMRDIKQFLGRNVDVYGSDACLMQMIEVAAEMKDTVDYFIGSQDLEPGEGWPYEPLMKKWGASPQISARDISILLSKEYLKAYSPGGVYGTRSVTMAAFDMSKIDLVINSTKRLGAHMATFSADAMKAVKAELSNVQSFYYSDYVDLGDFAKHIEALPVKKEAQIFSDVKAAIAASVVATDNSTDFAASTGMSIWVPSYESEYMTRYSGLEFSKMTGWDLFLKKLLQ